MKYLCMIPVYKICRAHTYATIKAQDACIEHHEYWYPRYIGGFDEDYYDYEETLYEEVYEKAYIEYLSTTPEIGLPSWCKHW